MNRVPKLGVTLLASCAIAASAPALGLELRESVEVPVSADEVWQVIAGFCAISDWHPVVTGCEESEAGGATMRRLTTIDGAVLIERRVQYSDEGMSYSYEIVDGPLPVADYVSTLAVMDLADSALITWSGEFGAAGVSDEDAEAAIREIYRAGLDGLRAELSR